MADPLVLVVQDDPASRLVLTHAISAAGFRVAVAQDGREALILFTDYGPEIDAVITDCRLAELDGLELSRTLRQRGSRVPILMVTSLDYSLTPETLCKNGIDFVMGKPFSPKAVVKLINDVIADRRAGIPGAA